MDSFGKNQIQKKRNARFNCEIHPTERKQTKNVCYKCCVRHILREQYLLCTHDSRSAVIIPFTMDKKMDNFNGFVHHARSQHQIYIPK